MSQNDFPDFDYNDKKKKNDEAAPTFTWNQVWTMALTRPSTATFETILSDPAASARRASNWIFITGAIMFVGAQMLTTLRYPLARLDFMTLVCAVPIGGLLSVFLFAIASGLLQLIAKLFGGRGSFGQFHYAFAAAQAPLMMINMLLSAFTASTSLALLNVVLFFYSYVLGGMALRAVNGFGWFRATAVLVIHAVIMVAVIVGIIWWFISKLSYMSIGAF